MPLHIGKGRTLKKALHDILDYVKNPQQRHGKSYDQWLGGKRPCHRDQLRAALDVALAQKPVDLDALVKLLEEKKAAYADYRQAREEM